MRAEMARTVSRIRSNPNLFRPFRRFPEADAWLARFEVDDLRYPILIVSGPSMIGKTEWANSLFKNPLELKIGNLAHFPEKMRRFDRKSHDGIVLDDVRDMEFLAAHQDVLQGKYSGDAEFGSTQGGTCAFFRWLFCKPIVATINRSTKNREYLETHDWLGKEGNRVVIELTEAPYVPGEGEASSSSQGPLLLLLASDGPDASPPAAVEPVQEQPQQQFTPAARMQSSVVRQLEALCAMHADGSLTADEFAAAKACVLGS